MALFVVALMIAGCVADTGGDRITKPGTGKDTTITIPPSPPPVQSNDFTETVNGVSFDMVFVPGGTFTLGCESGNCPADTRPVSGVRVSSYYIGRTEVTRGLWEAVMDRSASGFGGAGASYTGMTWYDAMEFACRLSQLTGRNYRMTTEAEWEYAAKNHLSRLERIGSSEEWAYNSWSGTHSGGTDPVGPFSGQHTQKTRRDVPGTVDNITGRLIRSIEGTGPALRLAISAEMDFPSGMVPPCDLRAPEMGEEPVNSHRDPRWVTGGGAHWTTGPIAIGRFDLRVWEDGTAILNMNNGQWFTSNNIAFVFVPNSGPSIKFAYVFLDET
ncbi:MAG TPA: SUMF1/EgtB/PvdO family nonheme iron enzyme, partial [Acidobacteriota bacterium]|nr:SUMF1/EgtB/PvdO family nonheme iron enzyme [Acidobacteriota bacterium]